MVLWHATILYQLSAAKYDFKIRRHHCCPSLSTQIELFPSSFVCLRLCICVYVRPITSHSFFLLLFFRNNASTRIYLFHSIWPTFAPNKLYQTVWCNFPAIVPCHVFFLSLSRSLLLFLVACIPGSVHACMFSI